MKNLMIAIALLGAAASTSAFAQTNSPTGQQQVAPASQQVTAYATSPLAQAGRWVPPYGQPVVGKTRAQVYQELVQAEQDGQLAYLNSTLYAH